MNVVIFLGCHGRYFSGTEDGDTVSTWFFEKMECFEMDGYKNYVDDRMWWEIILMDRDDRMKLSMWWSEKLVKKMKNDVYYILEM